MWRTSPSSCFMTSASQTSTLYISTKHLFLGPMKKTSNIFRGSDCVRPSSSATSFLRSHQNTHHDSRYTQMPLPTSFVALTLTGPLPPQPHSCSIIKTRLTTPDAHRCHCQHPAWLCVSSRSSATSCLWHHQDTNHDSRCTQMPLRTSCVALTVSVQSPPQLHACSIMKTHVKNIKLH